MQALRHCSICATGGVLQGRTDFLLQRTNMATLKRGAVCVNLFRNTASVLSSRKPSRQGLVRLTDVTCTSMVSLSVGSGLCAVPFTQQVENLSNESLVRKASLVVSDSANTYLSHTTLALVDSLTQYAKALHTLIALQRRYLASLGNLSAAEEDSIWQVIIGQRGEVSDRLEECNRFESNWTNAVNLCKLAAEAAYSTGAEFASITAKTNLQRAQSQVEDIRKLVQDAQKKLAEIKADEIQRMAEHASYLERGWEEVPEAYLRED